MIVEIRRQVSIARPPTDVLAFVMDIESFAQFDSKVTRVERVRRTENRTEFWFRPVLGGVPVPGPKVGSVLRLTPGRRIDIGMVPTPMGRLSGFTASFEATPTPAGCVLTRTLVFDLKAPFGRLIGPFLRRRVPMEVESELFRLQAHLEPESVPSSA